MAGTITHPTPVQHRSRGVVRTSVAMTADASGNATAAAVGVGFGRLVGVLLNTGTLDYGSCIITVSDSKTGAALLTLDTLALIAASEKFQSTTTGDTTGGTSEDLWTTGSAHGLVASDAIIFTSLTGNGAGGPTVGVKYYVVTGASLAATTFQLSDSVSHAVAGTNIVNVGSTDASASAWIKVGANTSVKRFFRPTTNIVDNAGATITAAGTAVDVNRSIVLAGRVLVGVTEGGNLGAGTLGLIVDEAGIGDLALTV